MAAILTDNAALLMAALAKRAEGKLEGALDDALQIVENQKESIDRLAVEFDRLYGDARSASMKLDASVKRGEARPAREYERLEEQVERLRPLFEEIRRRG